MLLVQDYLSLLNKIPKKIKSSSRIKKIKKVLESALSINVYILLGYSRPTSSVHL